MLKAEFIACALKCPIFKKMPISFQADLLGERYKEYSYKAFKCRPFRRCQIVIGFFTDD